MIAGKVLPEGTTFEQAYPVIKALITANSARRQGVPDEEFLGSLISEMENTTPVEFTEKSTNSQENELGPAGMMTDDEAE